MWRATDSLQGAAESQQANKSHPFHFSPHKGNSKVCFLYLSREKGSPSTRLTAGRRALVGGVEES